MDGSLWTCIQGFRRGGTTIQDIQQQCGVEYIGSSKKAENKPYKLGVNQFADLTNEEFKQRNEFKSHSFSTATSSFKYANVTNVPSPMDWRKKGAVTPVKDQGQCGCCWAFSAVASMEGIVELKTSKLISLYEQELVDCDTSGEDQGCNGGHMDDAFQFIIQNQGLTTETNYPYQVTDSTCNTNEAANHAASITGYEDVPANSESALLKAVSSQSGSVAIDAGESDFQFYSSGVKNSWGEQGYIRMQRDIDAKEGLCGIAMAASYPTA